MSKRIENVDPMSDPASPITIKFEDITTAAARIRPIVPITPCMPSHRGQSLYAMNIIYKMECVLPSGSFKERGCVNSLLQLANDKKKTGLVIATLGNHALAMCYHASRMKIPVTAIFPYPVSMQKMEVINSMGAKVLVRGSNIQDAVRMANALAKDKGMTYLSGRDHPHILAGGGTIGLEILEQVPNVDAVIVPVGTGGLISAVGIVIKKMKPSCLVYGVQSELMPGFVKALQVGEPVTIPNVNTIANTLQMTKVGNNAFHNGRAVIDKMLLVKEDWIARAMLHLIENERFIIEGAGACPLAAIMGNLVPELKTKNVVCVITGGNIDSVFLGRVLDRGMAAEGRLIKFKVGIRDSSVALAELMKLIADMGFNCVRFFRDHVWVEADVYHVEMRMIVEGRNLEHALELKRTLDKTYPGRTQYDTEPFNDSSMCPCYVSKNKAE